MGPPSHEILRTRHLKVQLTHFSFAVSSLSNVHLTLLLRLGLQKLAGVSEHSAHSPLVAPMSSGG